MRWEGTYAALSNALRVSGLGFRVCCGTAATFATSKDQATSGRRASNRLERWMATFSALRVSARSSDARAQQEAVCREARPRRTLSCKCDESFEVKSARSEPRRKQVQRHTGRTPILAGRQLDVTSTLHVRCKDVRNLESIVLLRWPRLASYRCQNGQWFRGAP